MSIHSFLETLLFRVYNHEQKFRNALAERRDHVDEVEESAYLGETKRISAKRWLCKSFRLRACRHHGFVAFIISSWL